MVKTLTSDRENMKEQKKKKKLIRAVRVEQNTMRIGSLDR